MRANVRVSAAKLAAMTIEVPARKSHRGDARSPATAETIPTAASSGPFRCCTEKNGISGEVLVSGPEGLGRRGSGLPATGRFRPMGKAEMKGIRCQLLCISGGLKSSQAGHMPIWD